jgi:hypothetical protein
MNMPFKLKSGADEFDFAIDGTASKAGARVGTWAVGADNKVSLTKDAGGSVAFDVAWQVNNQNQLELLQSGRSVFNFHSDATVRPMYSLDNAALVVKPDRNRTFSVRLHGDWTFTNDFLLQLKIGALTSTFDGFLNDSNHSAFVYHFNNKAKTTQGFDLAFTGQWAQQPGTDELKFIYDREPSSAGVTTGVFDLPHGLKLLPSVNQFAYQYSKANQTHSIQLSGRLVIGPDFRITYVLDDQISAGVRTTTFHLDTVFSGNDTDGNLTLEFSKAGGTTRLTVGGQFTHVFGATELQVGFSYSQTRSGATVSSVIGFNGELRATNGNKNVTWTIQKSGQALTIDVTAHVTLGAVSANGILNIQTDAGGLVGVTAMFGVHF